MKSTLRRFLDLPQEVKRLIVIELLLSLVNGTMMLIFNIYLRNQGYSDAKIAEFTSYRFVGVLILALPTGLMLRGRPLKPFLWASCVAVPVAAWFMVDAAEAKHDTLLIVSTVVSGIGMMLGQVAAMPFVLRATTEKNRTEAISLNFASWSVALFSTGLLVPLLQSFGTVDLSFATVTFDEPTVIRLIVIGSSLSLFLLLGLKEGPPPDEKPIQLMNADYDWGRIVVATIPNFFIAIGAGLTIPFISLFFNGVFGLESGQFSILGGCAGIPVLCGFLLNPYIKRRFGYGAAIVVSQSLSVVFLVLMALTELVQEVQGMLWVAAFCFLMRQPLMNMAAPIASDLAIAYVGHRNRELMSALGATVWSGSWFISAKIFQYLRQLDLTYWQIFLITAGLYVFATSLYARLIVIHNRQSGSAAP